MPPCSFPTPTDTRPSRSPSGLVGDRRGATAVEFALLAIPFFGMVLLVIQVGLYHFAVQSLDFATREAGRQVMTGKVPVDIKSADEFKTRLICPNVYWGMGCDKLVVNAYRVDKTSDSKTSTGVFNFISVKEKALKPPATDPAQASFCLGKAGDYVFVDVAYPFPNLVAGLLSSNAPATMMMRSTTFVFNEPFSAASSSGAC